MAHKPFKKQRTMGEVTYIPIYRAWYGTIEQHKGKRGYDAAYRYIGEYIAFCYGVSAEKPNINTLGSTAKKIVTKVLNSYGEDMQRRGRRAQECAEYGSKGAEFGSRGGAPIGNQNARKRTSEQAEAQRLEHPARVCAIVEAASSSDVPMRAQHPASVGEAEGAEAGGNTVYHIRPSNYTYTGNEQNDDNLWWWCDAGTNKEVEARITVAIAQGVCWDAITQNTLRDVKPILPQQWDELQGNLRKHFNAIEVRSIEPYITTAGQIEKAKKAIACIDNNKKDIHSPYAYLASVLQIPK